jgi:hypothetical protein
VLPAVFAPLVAGLVPGVGTWVVFKIVTTVPERRRDQGFRWGRSDLRHSSRWLTAPTMPRRPWA